VFGEVTQGLDVVERIMQVETDKNDRPLNDVRILKLKIISDPYAPKPAPKPAPKRKVRRR
jgi:peptidyl-prolyl cis-trans isomerase B (cyclophilin B)